MAEAAVLPQALVAYSNADWREEPFQFFAGGLSSPDDLTDASAVMGLRLQGQAGIVELTSDAGALRITLPNLVAITAPESLMSTMIPGLYDFDLVITYGTGDVETVLVGVLRIVGGIA